MQDTWGREIGDFSLMGTRHISVDFVIPIIARLPTRADALN